MLNLLQKLKRLLNDPYFFRSALSIVISEKLAKLQHEFLLMCEQRFGVAELFDPGGYSFFKLTQTFNMGEVMTG